jgi:ABC-2 type transport system permease protein
MTAAERFATPGSPRRDLRRYPRLLLIFWRSTFAVELEYRANFIANALLSLFWTAWAALGVRVFFRFSETVAGWTYRELLVVVGMFFSINGIRQALFDPNLARMTDYIRNGTLDFLITKPISTQFMVSLRHLGVYNLLDPLLGLGLSAVGLVLADHVPGPAEIASFIVMFTVAVLILYAMTMALIALSVRLINSDEVGHVGYLAVELGRFPVQLYRNPVQTILTIVPVAFLTTFPAQALLGELDHRLLLIGPLAGVLAVGATSSAFRRSLKTYTGASG